MVKYKISIEFKEKIDPTQLLMEIEDKLENFYSNKYKGSELISNEFHCLHCNGNNDCPPFKTVINYNGIKKLQCKKCFNEG